MILDTTGSVNQWRDCYYYTNPDRRKLWCYETEARDKSMPAFHIDLLKVGRLDL